MAVSEQRWGVIGGGMLGLTIARKLARNGHKVTLAEAAPELGGLASAWTLGELSWDRHYHVTLLSDMSLRALLRELDLEKEMRWVQTRTGFYTGGRLYSMSNSVEFLRFPPLGLLAKIRLAATILYASRIKDWKRLERISVAEWLRRWSGAETFEKIWKPLLKAKLGENYRITSAAFIWATIARMYAARRTGLKKEMFGYVPGGYGRILKRMGETLSAEGIETLTSHAVARIESTDSGQVRVQFRSGRVEIFDRVVVTAPATVAAALCPDLTASEKARLEGVQYLGVLCASVVLKNPLAGYYVTNITDAAPFTAVIEMSALVDAAEFGGKTLVYLPKYLTPDAPEFSLSDAEVEEIFITALLRMYPHIAREDVLCFRVSRARHVAAIQTLNYSESLPNLCASIPGVYFANSAHIVNGTLNVNETIQLGERLTDQMLTASAPQSVPCEVAV